MILSCRTGSLRGRRSLRDLYTLFRRDGWRGSSRCSEVISAVAAEAVDEAAISFVGALGGRGGPGDGAEELALLRGFAPSFFAGFGFSVEGLGDGGGAALLAEGEDLDVKLAAFVFDVEHVADVDLAGGLGGVVVGGDAVQVAGFGGLLAGLEEAGGP